MERHPRDSQGELVGRPPRVAYWLVPCERSSGQLQGLIDQLAKQFNAPRFHPHITLYAGDFGSNEQPELIVDSAARNCAGFTLAVQGLGFGSDYTKSCFLKVSRPPNLFDLTERFRRLSQHPGDYSIDPHISLLYGHVPESLRAEVEAKLTLPTEVNLNQVWAVSLPAFVRGRTDIERWRLMAELTLLPHLVRD
jgi:2'-5' RNA ligase